MKKKKKNKKNNSKKGKPKLVQKQVRNNKKVAFLLKKKMKINFKVINRKILKIIIRITKRVNGICKIHTMIITIQTKIRD